MENRVDVHDKDNVEIDLEQTQIREAVFRIMMSQ